MTAWAFIFVFYTGTAAVFQESGAYPTRKECLEFAMMYEAEGAAASACYTSVVVGVDIPKRGAPTDPLDGRE
jgi:hypothetical protein